MNWHVVAFVALAMLAGFGRGIHEGMVMVMPFDSNASNCTHGVRSHVWFKRYHIVSLARSLLAMALGATALLWYRSIVILPLIGSLFLLWEATEIGYAVARDGSILYTSKAGVHEHISFADILPADIAEGMVYLLHFMRVVTGITLILVGGVS